MWAYNDLFNYVIDSEGSMMRMSDFASKIFGRI